MLPNFGVSKLYIVERLVRLPAEMEQGKKLAAQRRIEPPARAFSATLCDVEDNYKYLIVNIYVSRVRLRFPRSLQMPFQPGAISRVTGNSSFQSDSCVELLRIVVIQPCTNGIG